MAITVSNYQEKRKIIGDTLIIQCSFDIQLTSGTSDTYSLEFNNLHKYARKLGFGGWRIKTTKDPSNSANATIQAKYYSKRNLLSNSDYFYMTGDAPAADLNAYKSYKNNSIASYFTDFKLELILSTDTGTPKWTVLFTLILSG